MQRWLSILVGFVVVAVAAVIVAKGYTPPKGVVPPPADAALLDALADAEGTLDGEAPSDEAGVFLSDYAPIDLRPQDGGVGSLLPDGAPVPPLPPGTPKQVKFGVILISYAGAQPNAAGQPPNPRSKAQALELAEKLAVEAQADFNAAVSRGDPGSAADLGHIRPGILEPATDYVLFTLPVGGVSSPIDTPRGYWIAKRLE